jgi:hypothetical protein
MALNLRYLLRTLIKQISHGFQTIISMNFEFWTGPYDATLQKLFSLWQPDEFVVRRPAKPRLIRCNDVTRGSVMLHFQPRFSSSGGSSGPSMSGTQGGQWESVCSENLIGAAVHFSECSWHFPFCGADRLRKKRIAKESKFRVPQYLPLTTVINDMTGYG